ncbi:MAG: hypothetical protein IKC59_06735 [Clostridia bacterium]|nr:hypothetical protein [Clostridia bacterium]
MYEYSPSPKKATEKLLMGLCLLIGAVLYGFGQILPYPAIYQLLATACFAAVVIVTVRFLLRDYTYSVIEGEDGAVDLTVTEIMGRKRAVVCRVAIAEIGRIEPLKKHSKADPKRAVYRYVSEFKPKDAYLLEILDEYEPYNLVICADETLIALLESNKKQYLSEL